MFDGSKKTIESIKIGDLVKAYDEETGQFVDSKVNNVFKKQTSSYLQITLDNGEIIEVTPEHPFYTNTGWLAAKELKQNSLIKAINGFISVQSINEIEEQSEVYNFEVEEYHTYLVGNAGAVVHNDCIRGKDGNLSWKEESYQLKNGETEVTDKATEARVALLEGAERAIKYMPAEVVDKFSSLLTPESLQFLAGVSVAYAISHGIGVGEAADLIMAGATYVWLGNEAISVLSDIGSFASGSINARTQVEMERASRHLANAIGTLTVDGTLINIGSGLGRLLKPVSPIAKQIANGHAYQKHVIAQKEFPEINNQTEFSRLIDSIIENPSAKKTLERGRTGYWDNKTGTLVIKDPNSPDGGTAFRPDLGKYYFDTKLK